LHFYIVSLVSCVCISYHSSSNTFIYTTILHSLLVRPTVVVLQKVGHHRPLCHYHGQSTVRRRGSSIWRQQRWQQCCCTLPSDDSWILESAAVSTRSQSGRRDDAISW
jgi:hypothetical protein